MLKQATNILTHNQSGDIQSWNFQKNFKAYDRE